jgi:hypothetical protein
MSSAAETTVTEVPSRATPTDDMVAPKARAAATVRRTGPRTSRIVIGRVDPWAVLKLSLLFYLSACVVLLVAGVLLWSAAASVGVIDNVENFIAEIGFDNFRFLPGQILRAAGLGGLVLVVAGSCANVLMTVLYNLIADVVGGLKITLVEDDAGRTRV